MRAHLTDDDVGKMVVGQEGRELGIVAAVSNGEAHVDPNPSVAERVMAKLGWENVDEDEDYVVTDAMIAEINDEVVLNDAL